MHRLYTWKQNTYWEQKVAESRGNPKRLWKTLDAVMCKDRLKKTRPVDSLTADGFLKAFEEKVESVRASTASAAYPVFDGDGCTCFFELFQPIDDHYIERLITAAPNKNCALDPAPTWLVKQFVNELSPFLAVLFNESMRSGTVPTSQKSAIVTPALKKPSLDPLDMGNYRPISNLSFISKMLERCVNDHHNCHLIANGLIPEEQSAYTSYHSTETAVF